MKKIIVAEKKSVGDAYANALNVKDSTHNGYYENNEWIVTWTVGHLITLSFPEKYSEELKEWKLETLPFLPEKMKYEVIEDVKKQFNIIKELYNRPDIETIYYAGDAGREGLYIQTLVRQFAGVNKSAKELVVWIDSQTNEEILKGIAQARDISEYDNMKKSGYMRAIEDYLTGINFSRLLSVKYSALVNSGSGQKYRKPISVGRVMTCVLGMIVNKEREIRNFKPKNFYRVIGTMHLSSSTIEVEWRCTEKSKYFNTPFVYDDFGFHKEADAKEFISTLGDKLKIIDITNKKKKKNPPLLFDLAELQSECSKKLHISPSQTLKVAQSLYEKKITTYPRTDARVLSTAVYKEIEKNLNGLKKGPYSEYISEIDSNRWEIASKCVDDSKVTDHYAIIPTGVINNDLSLIEKQVYELICRRFIAAFYPAAEYENIKIEAVNGQEVFVGMSKILGYEGFYKVLGKPEDVSRNNISDTVSVLEGGKEYMSDFSLKKGEVASPNRYSSGSIILAMKNAGSLIEDEELREQIKSDGIGRSSTRAEIIDKLIRLNYIELNEKTQILSPTNFGEMIYEVVAATLPSMLSVEITAEWERGLDQIASGQLPYEEYRKKLYEYIETECKRVIAMDDITEMKNRIKPYATNAIKEQIKEFDPYNTKIRCPLCGDEIETTSWGFKCKSNISKTEGCNFSIGDIAGHRLLTNELYYLLTTGKCGPFYDFVSEKKKNFAAYLTWDNETKRLGFEMTDMPWSKTELFCPICKSPILERDGYYKCAKKECDFKIGKILGKKIPLKQMELLTTKGSTEMIRGFKGKDDNSFNAALVWDSENNKITFKFQEYEEKTTNLLCPICKSRILSCTYGFKCKNYKKASERKEGDCSFFVGSVFGHTIKYEELDAICSGKKTEILKLKNKDNKAFEGRIYWDMEKEWFGVSFDENNPEELNCVCPICHESIIKLSKGYTCRTHLRDKDKCSFYIGVINGVLIDEKQMEKLAKDGKTDLISGFKSKSKNKYSAYVKWNCEEQKIEFEFPSYKETDVSTKYICPSCRSKNLKESRFGYYCDCGMNISKVIAEKKIDEEDIVKLITVGKTDVIKGFYSPRTRKKFNAALKLNGKKVEFEF